MKIRINLTPLILSALILIAGHSFGGQFGLGVSALILICINLFL